jgi:hypothetical protein
VCHNPTQREREKRSTVSLAEEGGEDRKVTTYVTRLVVTARLVHGRGLRGRGAALGAGAVCGRRTLLTACAAAAGCVSPTVSPSPCLSHRVSITVSLTVSRTVSPTVSRTVSPSLCPSPCLSLCLPHCASPTVSSTVSPSLSLSHRLSHSLSHCLSLCLPPPRLPHGLPSTVSPRNQARTTALLALAAAAGSRVRTPWASPRR